MADYRALCIELLDCLEKADWPHRYRGLFAQWVQIAHTALSEPKHNFPTDAELQSLAEQFFPDSGWRQEEIDFAKTVLLRYRAFDAVAKLYREHGDELQELARK
jgi:hypothetical protein